MRAHTTTTVLITALLFASTGSQSLGAEVYPEGMISYWMFEESDGSTAIDSVDGNDGSFTGPIVRTAGIVGTAIDLDDLEGVRIPHSANLNTTHAFTIELWAFPRSLRPSQYASFLVTKIQSSSSEYTNYALGILSVADGKRLQLRFGNVTWYEYYTGNSPIEENVWTHIVATYDGDASTLQFYVNGALDETFTDFPTDPIANSEPVFIGWNHEQTLSQEYFDGLIDEVAIYGRAITADEVQQHYQNGLLGLRYGESAVSIFTAVEIGWVSISGATYQVQYSTNLVSTNWFDLGDSMIATNATNYVFDSTRGVSNRFYRVIQE